MNTIQPISAQRAMVHLHIPNTNMRPGLHLNYLRQVLLTATSNMILYVAVERA